MPNRIGSTLNKTLYATLATTILTSGSAYAADDCLAAPNGTAPPGSHWYYHVDRIQQRHCWYLAAESLRVRHTDPEAQSAKSSAPTSQEADLPLPLPRPTTAPGAFALASVDEIRLPQAPTPEIQPDPAEPARESEREVVGAGISQSIDVPEMAATAVASAPGVRTIVPLLIALAVAGVGILQYVSYRILARPRRPIRVERGRAGRIASLATPKAPPPPASARRKAVERLPVEQSHPRTDEGTPDLEEGIRRLLHAMERAA